ncbi:unnamed protein product [Ixodes pacificus]
MAGKAIYRHAGEFLRQRYHHSLGPDRGLGDTRQ